MGDQLIVLCGESGAGKTSVALALEEEGYNVVDTYTTRPPRYEGEPGHIFSNQSHYEQAKINGEIIAETFFDDNFYWTTQEQYQGKGKSIYIVDPNGVKELRQNVIDASMVVIYLKCDCNNLYNRMRERCHSLDDMEKQRKRRQHDWEAFKIVPCDYVVDANRPLDEVIKLVKEVIEGGN